MSHQPSFFRTLKSLFTRKRTVAAASEKAVAPIPSGRLSVVRVLAYRRVNTEPLHLFCDRLGSTSMSFRTSTPMKLHECLELELFFTRDAPLKVTGQVQFIDEGVALGQTLLRGHMDLWTTPPQQEAILHFLYHRHEKSPSGRLGGGKRPVE
jgi:hypothetical protein